ncbi:glycosyltransferase family 4 protein [Candidatus Woesearchaeota archaeon]|nr:glycosyltransferase family 4 protein [Candidatus Woesearchaeota archaeon]
MPKHVLLLSYEFPPLGGGGGVVVKHLCETLHKQYGHTFDLITMGYKGLPKEEQQGPIHVYRVPCKRAKKELCTTPEMLSYLVPALLKAEQLAFTKHYDIAHVHFILPTGNLGIALKLLNRIPYIISTHGSDLPGYNPDRFKLLHVLLKPVWSLFIRNAKLVLTPSESLRSLLLASWNGSPAKVKAIHWGIDIPSAPRKKTNRILFAGRLFERKGAQYLIEAVKLLKLKDWDVTIVGDGPMRQELEKQAKGYANITFTGWLPREKLQKLYAISKIFVFPSTAESFGMVIAEAMAAEMAVITSNDSACPEVIGNTGMLVPPKDARKIADALKALIAHPAEITRLGKLARKRVLEKFTWEQCARQYNKLYQTFSRN